MAFFLLTGGAGFIGSNLARGLLAAGHTVRVVDDLSVGNLANLSDIAGDIEFIQADIRDEGAMARAVKGVDYVLHHAAVASVQRSVDDPVGTTAVNVYGTVNVLEQSRRAGVRRVVFAASSAVYGQRPEPVKHEDLPPVPLSPYAVQKYTCEMLCKVFSDIYGLQTVCLRYFNIFGPRQDPNSEYAAVIPRFISRMVQGKRPIVYGDGLQTRDFCYVENVVQANILAATSDRVGHGEVINIGSGMSINLLDLIAAINRLLGTSYEPAFEPARPGDVRHSRADISRARDLLRYDLVVDLQEGLKRTVEFFTESANRARG